MATTWQTNSSSSDNTKILVRFILLVLALLGFFSVLISTRWGVGTSPDSVVYIIGARNLALGQGFKMISESGELKAITHRAPFYSVVLALIDLSGPDPIQGGRWLNALLFGGNILLVGFLLQELLPGQTAQAHLAPVIGAGLILLPAMLVEIHSMAWSESLFIFLTLAGFWALGGSITNSSRAYLAGSAILIALAFLTRYIGAVLVATGVLSILLFSLQSVRRRLVDSALFSLISVGPIAFWLLHNALAGESATSRELLFHPITRQQVNWALSTLGSWVLLPDSSPGWLKILPYLVIGLLGTAVVIVRHRQYRLPSNWQRWATLSGLPPMIRILMVFIPFYLAFLLVSLTFLDANTPLDSRILSPVYVTGVILAVYFLADGLRWLHRPAVVRYALISLSFVFLAALAARSLNYIQSSYAGGIGFTSRWWRESPTLAVLQSYAPTTVVYSNAPEALYLYTTRDVRPMPKKYESANLRPNQNYEAELMALKEDVWRRGSIIVYFDPMIRSTLPAEREILETLGLKILEQTADGVIYGIKGQHPAGSQ
jgi:hypothetical protein